MTAIESKQKASLGTFSGVFTPSILTILGIILFLRLGYVVGNAGLSNALLIICIANLISVLTSFSLAAIATNMKVKGGGDYYLISRTLGVEFGGAIGIVLYLAQSVSIAFYCIGFGEAVFAILSVNDMGMVLSSQIIAFGALFFLFALAFAGADLATKFQYIVMVFLVLALVSFYIGGIQKWETAVLIKNMGAEGSGSGFWVLFALFFPAVTGFTQGVSMSGDLKDPGKSLPAGTFLAVFISIIVYFTVAVVFAASNPLDVLMNDYGAMKKTAAFGFFIDAGVISATLSSAMASFLGAPRILQSLASDKIFPVLNPFSKGAGAANNPRRGVMLSLAIAIAVIALGQLDLIARVVSMFFLISYGLLNYATYFEAATLNPSFRPRFKWYKKGISLAGFLACAVVILAIDIKTGIAACAVLFAIFQYLKRTQGPARWADSQRSYHLQQVRANLLAAQQDLSHPREWRPYVLALSNNMVQLEKLLAFSRLIEGGSGMTTAVRMIHGSGYTMAWTREHYLQELKKMLVAGNHHAFPLVVSSIDGENGISTLLQSYGIGPVKANTALFDYNEIWYEETHQSGLPRYKNHIRLSQQTGCNIVLLDMNIGQIEMISSSRSEKKQIDVWWNNDDSSRLALLLAYLMTRSDAWQSARIRVLAINFDRENDAVIDQLTQMLEDVRITAVPHIVLGLDADTIISRSQTADFVFFPVGFKNGQLSVLSRFAPERVLPKLTLSAMVMAASRIDLESDPEEGQVKEFVMIHDELEHALKRSEMAKKAAVTAQKVAREKMDAIKNSKLRMDPDLEEKIKQMMVARKQATHSKQKALKENAKLQALTQKAKEQGFEVADSKDDTSDQ